MRITILTLLTDGRKTHDEGTTDEWPDEVARRWIERGWAVAAPTTPEAPEAAVIAGAEAERATLPRAKPKA